MQPIDAIGEKIRLHRQSRSLTQEQLAQSLGYSKSFISLVESGERTLSDLDIERMASELGTTAEDLRSHDLVVHYRKTGAHTEEDLRDFVKEAQKLMREESKKN